MKIHYRSSTANAVEKDSSPSITLKDICWRADCIQEIEDQRTVRIILAADIHHVTLRRGFTARNPLLQLVFGIVLTAVSGAFFVVGIWRVSGLFLSAILFVLLGLYLLYEAVDRGHYLEIHLHHGRDKIAFRENLTPTEIEEFISTISTVSSVPLYSDL